MKLFLKIIILLIGSTQILNAQLDYLKESLSLYNTNSDEAHFEMKYERLNSYLAHNETPWQINSSIQKGTVWVNGTTFFNSDTLYTSSEKNDHSKTEFYKDQLYLLSYRAEDLKKVTYLEIENYFIQTLSYSPILLLQHFNDQKKTEIEILNHSDDTISYRMEVGEFFVTIYINKITYQVEKISTLTANEKDDQFYGFGDVEDIYYYNKNIKKASNIIPSEIIKQELNGQLMDTVTIHTTIVKNNPEKLVTVPADFTIEADVVEKSNITVEKYTENIYFINLHHCGTRSLLVEFDDFLLVAESPLNSKYGDQLLKEIKKINSIKPIKYYVFGHFHPHYTGGIRPFVHEGAKIICLEENETYINSIVDAKHTLNPDQLALDPKEVQFETLFQAKTITDGSFDMTIFHIGKKSNHTNDYLIYYFPKEKMIFEDDLVWINESTDGTNVSPLTRGFYQAVKDLNLEVKEVVQNWSVFDKEDKMIFQFKEIEKIFVK